MLKQLVYLIFLVSFATTSSCSAAWKSGQTVVITSTPAGADVFIGGKYQGVTPRAFALPRNHSHRIVVQKEGFGPQYVDVRPQPSKNNHKWGWCSTAGTVVGAATGLILTKGCVDGFGGLAVVVFTCMGSVAGSVIGLVGWGTEKLVTTSRRKLSTDRVHFNLLKDGHSL